MSNNVYDSGFIREVQNMLRIIGRSTGENELIIPENGILDSNTSRAIIRFKTKYGLPGDNIIDSNTFDKILEIYDSEVAASGLTASVRPYPRNKNYELSAGEVSELVYILQLMLNALSLYYDIPRLPVNGSFGAETENAVRIFQKINMLPISGRVDRATWSRLAEEYNETVNDSE